MHEEVMTLLVLRSTHISFLIKHQKVKYIQLLYVYMYESISLGEPNRTIQNNKLSVYWIDDRQLSLRNEQHLIHLHHNRQFNLQL